MNKEEALKLANKLESHLRSIGLPDVAVTNSERVPDLFNILVDKDEANKLIQFIRDTAR